MKTLLRIVGGIAVLAVAVVVAGVAVLKSMDFDNYRGLIAEQVKAATGRDLTIAGSLKLDISLTPALAVENVTFANAPGASRPEMVVLKRLAAEVQLMPLLRGNVRVNRLVLNGLDVWLEVDSQGRANWDIAPPDARAPKSGADPRPLPLVHKVDVRDVRLSYRDARDGTAHDVAVDAFTLSGKDAQSPIDATMKAVFAGRPVYASARLGGLATLMNATARYHEHAPHYPVRLFAETTGLKASFDGYVIDPRALKSFEFAAAIQGESIAAIAALARPAGAAPPALPSGPLKAKFRIKGQGRDYVIESLAASVGASDLAGSARAALAGRVPVVSATLNSRRLDLKALLPAAPAAQPARAKEGRVFSDDPLPLEALRAINADLAYKAETLVLPGSMILRDVDAKVALKDGRLALPIELTAGGGRVKGEATIDGTRAPARVALRLGGDNVDWGRMLAEAGVAEAVRDSKAEVTIDVRGAGSSPRAAMASLEGEAKVVLGPGRVGNKYLDLAGGDAVTQILTAFNPFARSDEFTALQCAVARSKVVGGVVDIRDGFAIETGKMTVFGGGTINLGTERLDLAFKPEARQGFGVGLGNLVGQVRIQGTLAEPSYGLDPLAAVTGTVGAVTGVLREGLSTLTRPLSGERARSDVSPCQVALGVAPRPQAAPPAQPERQPAQPERKDEGFGGAVRGIGEGIGRGLKGILGR
jgi:uncharacterized protein involved in outer membrane biogenesis